MTIAIRTWKQLDASLRATSEPIFSVFFYADEGASLRLNVGRPSYAITENLSEAVRICRLYENRLSQTAHHPNP